jgi:hypothetical protein
MYGNCWAVVWLGFAEKSSSTFRWVSSIFAKGVEPAAVTAVLNESPEKADCSWRRPLMEFVDEEFVDDEFVDEELLDVAFEIAGGGGGGGQLPHTRLLRLSTRSG